MNYHNHHFTLTSLLAIFVANNGEFHRPLKGMQHLSINCQTPEQLTFIKSYVDNLNMDILKLTHILDESIEMLVTANELPTFKHSLALKNISYGIIVKDVEEAVREETRLNQYARLNSSMRWKNNSFDYYPRYQEIERYLMNLVENYENIAKLEQIGYTFEGRPIYAMKISNGGNGKPKILIDAGIHAREWLAPSTALYTIHQLVTNTRNAYLYKNVDWYIIPSINPDGYEYTHTTYRLWRKTRSINAGSPCYGADANRNFELKWMTIGASNNPCSDIYAGRKAFSEVETRAFKNFVLTNKNTIKVYLTLHSFGQYFLHPWGYTSHLPDNEPLLRSVAENAAMALSAKFGTKYVVGSSTNILYPAAGGSDDWTMGIAGADLSYTIELPGGRFDPPPSYIESVGIETFEAFKVFHQFIETKYINNN